MQNKKIGFILILALIALCFIACKEAEDTQADNSSVQSTTSRVPIVIVDDEDNTSSLTQSEIDEWENTTPNINVEVNDSQSDNVNSSDEQRPNDNSSDVTTSEKDESDNHSSENQSSDDSASKENDTSEPNRPDDGYFDVAV